MNDFWRRLLYRWFVQYNPLYLVSAMLVLGGTILTSRGLATEGSLYGPLGVAAIAEVYAVALIGGAALLTRIGQRRPAVMLALLTALYQCDLTLHTETCVQLGVAGACAAGAWLALFVLKLLALGWAMKVRISPAAFGLAALGAAGLIVGPYLVEEATYFTSGTFIAVWMFALGLLAPHAAVTSAVPLDAWGQTVLRRATTAIWSLWGLLLSLHVLFWANGHRVALGVVIPTAALLMLRRFEHEFPAWTLVGVLGLILAFITPDWFSLFAMLTSAVLAIRAYSKYWTFGQVENHDAPGPYRMGEPQTYGGVRSSKVLAPLSDAAKSRHLASALLCFYLGVWTMGWKGGHWPAHVLIIDVAVLGLAFAIGLRLKRWLAMAVPAATFAHVVIASGIIPTPRSTLGWGSSALVLGFALLVVSLAASYRLRKLAPPEAVTARET